LNAPRFKESFMHRLLVVFTLVASACAGFGQDAKETAYTMVLSEEARRFCQSLGVPEPSGRLVLRSDSTFRLSSLRGASERMTRGKYTLAEGSIALASEEDGSVSIGTYGDERVVLGGFTYQRLASTFKPGLWTLRRNGAEDETVHFTFDAKGGFSYSGMQLSSKGHWALEEDSLVLTWTEIDGQPVERGFVVRKRIPLGPGFFQVDQYRYEQKVR
jgi:hypothetical protein